MDLFLDGATLMVIGMATVFAFLIILVMAMGASASFFSKFSHLFPEEAVKVPAKKSANVADPITEIAVALAVIKAKRG